MAKKHRLRGDHRVKIKGGQCTRCGLTPRGQDDMCPPGFFMSKDEIALWEQLDTEEQRKLTRRLGKERISR